MRMDAASYGDACAAFYDRIYTPPTSSQIALLRALTGDGSAYELGIGTGRVALPLAAAGTRVGGIEASAAMRAELRRRAGGSELMVHDGDFAAYPLGGPHRLIFALVGTLSLLPSRATQRACLENIAAHLEGTGQFLYECSDPLETASGDEPLHLQHRLLIDDQPRDYPVRTLSLSLTQLDAMADAAGLALFARWGDWRQGAWREPSSLTISLYRRRARA